jgi:hypothetical protein
MTKFDPTITWLRKQLANATKAISDLKSGQKIELGGEDVTEQWIETYERLVSRYERLIDAYERRNRETRI